MAPEASFNFTDFITFAHFTGLLSLTMRNLDIQLRSQREQHLETP